MPAPSRPQSPEIPQAADISAALAGVWLARLDAHAEGAAPAAMPLPRGIAPDGVAATLAEVVGRVLAAGRTLLVVVPGDDLLADLADAVDPGLRPLCLMLPAADFAGHVVVRATLSLLKSRMTRATDEGSIALWNAQQERLARHAEAWQACLAWSRDAADDCIWPETLSELFPVRIVVQPGSARILAAADYAIAVAPARLVPSMAPRQLLVQMPQPLGGLVRSDGEAALRAQLAMLTQETADLELELATVQAEVGEFAHRYFQEVGARMAELDALHADLAQRRAEQAPGDATAARAADEASARAERSQDEQQRHAEYGATEKPFRPSADIKRLYRQVARRIHPDRAEGEADRRWRTGLMSEANRAYRAGDESALRAVLQAWQERRAEPGTTSAAESIAAQVERLRRRLAEIEGELARIFASRLYEVFIAARLARRHGRDLLAEMAADLDARIAAARSAPA